MDAATWSACGRIYEKQLASHGMGAGACDRDERHRHGAVGYPRQGGWAGRCTGCWAARARPIPAYAGGVSLGYQDPARWWTRPASACRGLQGGEAADGRQREARPRCACAAVRKAFGDDIDILTDANTGYTLADVRQVMPGLDELGVGWLEEPFPRTTTQLRAGGGPRQRAARRRREPLHALRVQPRDRGWRHHHPAARPVEDRRHHRGAAHRRPRLGLEAADQPAHAP